MRYLASLLLAVMFTVPSFAQYNAPSVSSAKSDPHSVAIRWWGQGMVSIESWWDLTVVIDPYNDKIGYEVPELTADLVLVTHEHGDHNNVEAVKGEPVVARGLNSSGEVHPIWKLLDRFANSSETEWWWRETKADSTKQTSHSVVVRSIPAWHDDSQGKQRGATALFKIEVDGVSILHCGDLGQSKLTDKQIFLIGPVDVMLLPVGGVYTIDSDSAWDIVEQVKPRIVIPIHFKTDKLKIPLEPVDKFVEHMPAGWELDKVSHNTLAVKALPKDAEAKHKLVVLDYKPWQPTGELAELMKEMDTACQESQKVFAPLTANQMSWQPPNGTHTPRWNAEHMMGRQLGFFSQIYSEIDPETFSHIDLNPAQMPPDYKPAHPDWDGAEEARQMQRANAYVRRFAYLLNGVDLDRPAPGSRWTLRRLLKQMDRHFGEHTASVQQKFELEGWPAE